MEKTATRTRIVQSTYRKLPSVRIIGPFDAMFDHVLEFVNEYITRGHANIILDLSETTYMTSQGIGCLIKVIKRMNAAEKTLYIVGATGDMIELICMAKIEKFIKFVKG
jgi:anti-anti-sigma factor